MKSTLILFCFLCSLVAHAENQECANSQINLSIKIPTSKELMDILKETSAQSELDQVQQVVSKDEVTPGRKAQSLYLYLTERALKNGTPANEKGYTFTQKDIGEIAYYLDYYRFSVEDLKATETEFAKADLKISSKNFTDALYLLRSFGDVGRIMRNYEQVENMKCRYLYGNFQDHALAVSSSKQLAFKNEKNEDYIPTFVGGCWTQQKFPARYFPSY